MLVTLGLGLGLPVKTAEAVLYDLKWLPYLCHRAEASVSGEDVREAMQQYFPTRGNWQVRECLSYVRTAPG